MIVPSSSDRRNTQTRLGEILSKALANDLDAAWSTDGVPSKPHDYADEDSDFGAIVKNLLVPPQRLEDPYHCWLWLSEFYKADPIIPVWKDTRTVGWPETERGPPRRIRYVRASAALGCRFFTDAHITAYSAPWLPYRLNTAAVET